MKVYNVKSNARRAARAAGLDPDQAVRIVEGGFVVHGLAATATAPMAEAPDLAEAAADESVPQFVKDTFRRGTKAASATPEAEAAKPEPTGKGARKAARGTSGASAKAGERRPAKGEAAKAPKKAGKAKPPAAAEGAARENKGNALVDMVKRPEGVTVAEAAERFGWLPHTTRAAISVQCRKAGLTVTTEAVDGRGRVYRAA